MEDQIMDSEETIETTDTEIIDDDEGIGVGQLALMGAGVVGIGVGIFHAAKTFVPKGVSWLNHKLNKDEYPAEEVEGSEEPEKTAPEK